MHTDLLRVLVAEEESALLFSLSTYLTFRGCLVDSTERIDDARSLVNYLQYDVVVVGARSHSLSLARLLTGDIAKLAPSTRVILLVLTETASSFDALRRRRAAGIGLVQWCALPTEPRGSVPVRPYTVERA